MELSRLVQSITPYTAGEQPQDMEYVKINTNENPYAPSKGVLDVLNSVDIAKLRLYPDPNNTILTNTICECFNVKKENVFLGNGSDEVLGLCFPAFFDPNDKPVCFADVTYSFYKVWAKMFSINAKVIPLKEDFTINYSDYLNIDAKGIIITNPNAPTGIMLNKEHLIKIIEENKDKVVIVDEAYVDFSEYSMIEEVNNYDNLLVVRTLSKSYSLAGIRCGFAIGNKKLIDALNTVKNSFNSYTLSYLTQQIATSALKDKDYYMRKAQEIISTREWTVNQLNQLGFYTLPSQSNFVFTRKTNLDGEELYKSLKAKGILVRYFKQDRIKDFIRVTIGTNNQMQKFIDTLKTII